MDSVLVNHQALDLTLIAPQLAPTRTIHVVNSLLETIPLCSSLPLLPSHCEIWGLRREVTLFASGTELPGR
jgi:hypothetical protein